MFIYIYILIMSISLPKYLPFVINIPIDLKSVFDNKTNMNDIYVGSNQDYPRFSLAFQHYIHATKKGKELLIQFENKKKVYNVMNPFETVIDNYDKSITDLSKKFFDIKENHDIISDNFYKIWEMMFMFDIIDINKSELTSLHMSDDGAFAQSVLFFREKYSDKSKSDKHYILNMTESKMSVNQKFINYYDKQKPKKVIEIKDIKDKCQLITCNPTLDDIDETNQEGAYLNLLLLQIYKAISAQSKEGLFICKIFETYTTSMIKIIAMLKTFYAKIFITKPLTSRPSISEKYIVCIGFKYVESDKEYKEYKSRLENMTKKIDNKKVMDIFTDYNISTELKNRVLQMNITLMNSQSVGYNRILTFIEGGNYYGDEYQKNRTNQIEANEYWNNLFLIDDKDYKTRKTKINEISFTANKLSVDKAFELNKKII